MSRICRLVYLCYKILMCTSAVYKHLVNTDRSYTCAVPSTHRREYCTAYRLDWYTHKQTHTHKTTLRRCFAVQSCVQFSL